VTIRKDLEILHNQGRAQRTHGGALPAQAGALLDPSLREKEKLKIQKADLRVLTKAGIKITIV
jgi:DeoR family transcriptional regulator of aga operon